MIDFKKSKGSANSTWIDLWKFSLPENVKKILWRINTNSLPTICNLFVRKINSNVACPICLQDEENEIHIMWNSGVANDLWNETKLPIQKWLQTMSYFTQLWDMMRKLEQLDLEKVAIVMGQL